MRFLAWILSHKNQSRSKWLEIKLIFRLKDLDIKGTNADTSVEDAKLNNSLNEIHDHLEDEDIDISEEELEQEPPVEKPKIDDDFPPP